MPGANRTESENLARVRCGTSAPPHAPRIAVMVPAYNEELAIPHVVRDFIANLPDAIVYVYDNNSTDATAASARTAGAVVRQEQLQGKGHVVRRMFADIDADIYVLVDGDNTYDAAVAPEMVRLLIADQLDMVVGLRVANSSAAYRRGHVLGNAALTAVVRYAFGNRIGDLLSGYRVFSRRFVKSFPALASGFETETEFTVHALELRMPIREVRTAYRERPAASPSKLRTYSDGWRILRSIILLIKDQRPVQFFGLAGLVLLLAGIGAGFPIVVEFLRTGLVPRLPTAVLATGLVLLSFLSFTCGLILDSVARGRREMKRLAYLNVPGIGAVMDGAERSDSRLFELAQPALQSTQRGGKPP